MLSFRGILRSLPLTAQLLAAIGITVGGCSAEFTAPADEGVGGRGGEGGGLVGVGHASSSASVGTGTTNGGTGGAGIASSTSASGRAPGPMSSAESSVTASVGGGGGASASSGGMGGGGGAAGCTAIFSGACGRCGKMNCCAESAACSDDTDCALCLGGQGTGCNDNPLFTSLSACFETHCSEKCMTLNECNPITNEGCGTDGSACDATSIFLGRPKFICFGPPNDAVVCGACNDTKMKGPFCAGGSTCLENETTCSRYCCDDGDCGTGTCDKSRFLGGVGVCITGSPDVAQPKSACDAPAQSPSKGSCVSFTPPGAGGGGTGSGMGSAGGTKGVGSASGTGGTIGVGGMSATGGAGGTGGQ